jgi:hypothetical protein
MLFPRILIRATLLGAALSLSVPAAWADPPGHAPAHGYRAKHRYVYYPERELYYAPESRLWFWMQGADWRVGANLPAPYQQYTSGGITIELGSERPFTEHVYVVERYGKGSKHKKHKHHKHR